MTKKLLKEVQSWLNDFEKSCPQNLMAEDSGSDFEQSAYGLFHRIWWQEQGGVKEQVELVGWSQAFKLVYL